MQYRYIYKITCTAGSFKGKFYFGQRTTNRKNDSYKGSGTILLRYYKKHPNDYIKEIISYHNSQEELNQAEYDIIKPWLNNPMCLNLRDGGMHGTISDETKKRISESGKGREPWNKGKIGISDETRKKLSESHKGKVMTDSMKQKISLITHGREPWNKGKKLVNRSKETRCKISESLKLYYKRKREQELSCSL